jgi:hypothetical protein
VREAKSEGEHGLNVRHAQEPADPKYKNPKYIATIARLLDRYPWAPAIRMVARQCGLEAESPVYSDSEDEAEDRWWKTPSSRFGCKCL